MWIPIGLNCIKRRCAAFTRIMCFSSAAFLPFSLVAYADADWGGCIDTRRSTTGFFIVVNDTPIVWKSKKQTGTALSSGEAEYIALSTCAKEVSWIRKLFWEIAHQEPFMEGTRFAETELRVDSSAAISLTKNPQVWS